MERAVIYLPFLYVLFLHWIADFVCQTNWMASNKSKSLMPPSVHIATYTNVLGVGVWIGMLGYVLEYHGGIQFMAFVAVNGSAHFWTDFFTSRITSRLWAKGDVHNFFVVIGLDQFLHYVVLGMTMGWIA